MISMTGFIPDQGGASTGPNDGVLGDGCVAHTFRSELIEQRPRNPKRAPVLADILPQKEDGSIPEHLLPQSFANGLLVGEDLVWHVVRDLYDQGRGNPAGRPQTDARSLSLLVIPSPWPAQA